MGMEQSDGSWGILELESTDRGVVVCGCWVQVVREKEASHRGMQGTMEQVGVGGRDEFKFKYVKFEVSVGIR